MYLSLVMGYVLPEFKERVRNGEKPDSSFFSPAVSACFPFMDTIVFTHGEVKHVLKSRFDLDSTQESMLFDLDRCISRVTEG